MMMVKREWKKSQSAGFEPARVTPIDFKSIAVTTWLRLLLRKKRATRRKGGIEPLRLAPPTDLKSATRTSTFHRGKKENQMVFTWRKEKNKRFANFFFSNKLRGFGFSLTTYKSVVSTYIVVRPVNTFKWVFLINFCHFAEKILIF